MKSINRVTYSSACTVITLLAAEYLIKLSDKVFEKMRKLREKTDIITRLKS